MLSSWIRSVLASILAVVRALPQLFWIFPREAHRTTRNRGFPRRPKTDCCWTSQTSLVARSPITRARPYCLCCSCRSAGRSEPRLLAYAGNLLEQTRPFTQTIIVTLHGCAEARSCSKPHRDQEVRFMHAFATIDFICHYARRIPGKTRH